MSTVPIFQGESRNGTGKREIDENNVRDIDSRERNIKDWLDTRGDNERNGEIR